MKPFLAEIDVAQEFLRRYIKPSRLVCARSLERSTGAVVYLKLESEQPTGSFKVRGALYALHVRQEQPVRLMEVVASSTGNHGAAVAWAGKLLNVPVKIFLPHNANPTKENRIRELGAQIIRAGKDLDDAHERASAYAVRTGAFLLNDATNPAVPVGAATIAAEIADQIPSVSEIWVPIGDTALIRGIATFAKHLQPAIRIVGVQAERAPAYYLSWKRGLGVRTDTCDTIADGLATRTPIEENVRALRELVDDVRVVTEEQMLRAIGHLLTEEHILAEPAGAATTAAWLAESYAVSKESVVLLISGSNVAEPILRRALNQEEHRLRRLAESKSFFPHEEAG